MMIFAEQNIGKQMNIDKKAAFLFFCQCATMKGNPVFCLNFRR